jgi:predicted Zn-ribbon and HTH transcriptional regulator
MYKSEVYEIIKQGEEPTTTPIMSPPVKCDRCGAIFKYNLLAATVCYRPSKLNPGMVDHYIPCPVGRVTNKPGFCALHAGGYVKDTSNRNEQAVFYKIDQPGTNADASTSVSLVGPVTCNRCGCVFHFNKDTVQMGTEGGCGMGIAPSWSTVTCPETFCRNRVRLD